MQKVKDWVASHSDLSHAVAVGIAFLFGAYFQVPQFHDLVTHYYGLLPQSAKEFVATVIALVGFYRNTAKSKE